MNARRGWLLRCILLLSCGLIPLAGCMSQANDPHLIRIVSSMPRQGSAQNQTNAIANGIKMAIDEAGAKVGDFKIEYLDLDDSTAAQGDFTAEAEAANAHRAVQDPNVMVYIGTYNSGAAKQSMPILNAASITMISPANTSPELTKPGTGDKNEPATFRPSGRVTYFRVVPTDDLQGARSADWAKEMGLQRVYILDDKQVYGGGVAKFFEQECEKIGLTVLGHQQIDAKTQEYRSLMVTIKATNPDLIYFGGTTQSNGGQLVKDMVSAGMENCKFMAPDGCYENAFIKSAGPENANGRCFVTFGGRSPDKLVGKGKAFVERYQKLHGEMPEAYAVYGYECANVALEAIRKAGQKDREAIAAACRGIKDFDGALGRWSFDENGDTTLRLFSGITVEDGKFKFVKYLGSDEEEKP